MTLPPNLGRLLAHQAARLGPRPALRHKRLGLYRDAVSWAEYYERALAVASALLDAGIAPGDRVGVLGENSVDWLVADMGLLLAGAVNVPPHAPLTAKQVRYQIEDAGVAFAFVADATQLAKLPPGMRAVSFDPRTPGVESFEAFRQRGRLSLAKNAAELERRDAVTGPASLATIMYTSGTTGNPKGVMLTHGNLVSNAVASLSVQPYGPDSVVLNWLPFTHIYARTVDHYAPLWAGVTIALAVSAETLVENLAEVRPTHFASVPRFYEKVLAAVFCPDAAEVGRRLRHIFGPRITILSSGGAPLPVPVARPYLDAGLPLLQGYGLTESSPVISFNTLDHNKIGTVGRAIPGVEVRTAPDGEVLTRGPHIMPGYWNAPEATAEAIRDGWLHTGDSGSLDDEGFLTITGRKKDLMVLSNGKKVVPAEVECLLLADPCIDQVVVVGEGRHYLAALVVPNWPNVRAALPGLTADDATSAEVRSLLEARCRDALRDVSAMERVKRIAVLPHAFSIEAEELTVSLKVRRSVILERYAGPIEELYRREGEAGHG